MPVDLLGDIREEAEATNFQAAAKSTKSRYKISKLDPNKFIVRPPGRIFGLYGETASGKSTFFASLPFLQKKFIPDWQAIAPKTADLLNSNFLPEIKKVGIMDGEFKWGVDMASGSWRKRGYTEFFKNGEIEVVSALLPRKAEIIDSNGATIVSAAGIEDARQYYEDALDGFFERDDIDAICIDPLGEYLNLLDEKFYAMMGRVMPSPDRKDNNPVDTEGLKQVHYTIRNRWFHEMLKKIRASQKWVFTSFRIKKVPPGYQEKKEVKDDLFDTKQYSVEWVNMTDHRLDQVYNLTRAPGKTPKEDKYYWNWKKGPFRPDNGSLSIPNTQYVAPVVFNDIADSMMN